MTYKDFKNRYKSEKQIGSGGFGKVFKVYDREKKCYVALKVADVKPEWGNFNLNYEVELVKKLPEHRNIARYDTCYRFKTDEFNGEQDFAILKFYEYGNLEQFLGTQELTGLDKKIIIRGILNGVDFLHDNDFVHRDLKAQNILLHRDNGIWSPKIIDFGLSRQMKSDSTITTAIGISYAYAAPEQIKNTEITKSVDLWAVGVIIYRIIAGELPFKSKGSGSNNTTQSELIKKIINVELPEKLETLKEPYQTMIKKCLVYDPLKRVQSAADLNKILDGEKLKLSPTSTKKEFKPKEKKNEEKNKNNPTAKEKSEDKKKENNNNKKANNKKVKKKEPTIKKSDHKVSKPKPIQQIPPDKSEPFIEKKEKPAALNLERTTKKKNKWLWYVIPFVLLFSIVAIFWNQEPPLPPPTYSELIYELTIRNEKAKDNKGELNTVKVALESLIKQYPKQYESHYVMAINRTYNNSPKESFQQLKKAAEISIGENKNKILLEKMEKDKNTIFKELSSRFKNPWRTIVSSLEE